MSNFPIARANRIPRVTPTRRSWIARVYRWWRLRDLGATVTDLQLRIDDLRSDIEQRERYRAELHWTRRSPKADLYLSHLRDRLADLLIQREAVQGPDQRPLKD